MRQNGGASNLKFYNLEQGIGRAAVLLRLVLLFLGFVGAMACSVQKDPRTVVMVIESSPLNLDPRIGTDAQSERIGSLIFDSLLRRDESSNLHPWLAERWDVTDPLTYIFYLRKDVRFHNGQPLTAQDVVYTFESLLSGQIKSLKTSSFNYLESIQARDDFTVVFRLKEARASFLWNMTQGAIGIVPNGATDELAVKPIGTGPFRFVSAALDEHVILERNNDAWGEKARIEKVEFKVVPDATTRALEIRKGAADIALNSLTADMVESLRKEPNLKVYQEPGISYQYIAFNLESPKLPVAVRQAIAYGIDREPLIRYLWQNSVQPASSILPAQHWAYSSDTQSYSHDPEKAKGILDRAGFTPGLDGVRLRLQMKTSTDQTGRELAAVLQEQLRLIGIELDIRSFEFATFYADIVRGSFEMYSLRWAAGNDDPDIFDYAFHSTKIPPSGANRGRYKNVEVDRLIEEARSSSDQTLRKANYARVQQILNEELPYIHLWYMDNVCVYSSRLSNLHLFPTGNYEFLTEVELNKAN